MMSTIPGIKRRQRPETYKRDNMAVQRLIDLLRHDIVEGGQTEGSQPNAKQVVTIEPIDNRIFNPTKFGRIALGVVNRERNNC